MRDFGEYGAEPPPVDDPGYWASIEGDLTYHCEPSDHINPPFGIALQEPAGRGDRLQIIWFEDIRPQLDTLWLIERTLPQAGIAVIYGHPGSGKTFLALDMAMHVSLGWEWDGHAVRKGVVVYVAAEGQRGLQNRVIAFKRQHGVDEAPVAIIPTPIDLFDPSADCEKLAAAGRAAAEKYGEDPVLIVVDTISKTMGAGKENTDDLAIYVRNCEALSAAFGCCVLPVHHRPKDSESSDPRGHSSLKGGIETLILVEGGETRRARITKQKDGEERELLLFNLHVHEVGLDARGCPVTSCTITPSTLEAAPAIDPFNRAVAKLSDGAKLVYQQLVELIRAGGTMIPPSIPDAEIDRLRVGKVALLEAWRDKSISAAGTGAGHTRDAGKKAFNRALDRLRTLGIVRVWEEWAWITHSLRDEAGT
jgi:KaiC/GvpD/RAD55 family RecA-like ATPase